MANQEQLEILKQGVETWNRWREGRLVTTNDLSEADLSGANLRGAYLSIVNLKRADLNGADLRKANLQGADLRHANLNGADLREAELRGTDLNYAYLYETNFSLARIAFTIFGDVNIRGPIGLEYVEHSGPSQIAINTLRHSAGKIPEVFLRGCGLSDGEIEMVKLYDPGLNNDERSKILYKIYDLQASQAIQISPLFVSYSHVDSEFVNKIGNYLTKKGIRYWRDIHDMISGRVEKQIDRAIRQNPTVLLILSEHSIKSDWVEHEVRTARELEKEMGRDVLCPVSLDDSWKESRWPKRVMEQVMEYNILDFSAWEDDSKFGKSFNKLIDGLELFYKR
jgi:hypothetical protein